MSDLIVLGTDTDAGKTTFALLWMTAFIDQDAYWKPVETGESDTERVRRLLPNVVVIDPIARFAEPVAPPLAARREGGSIPSGRELARRRPHNRRSLLIETFGGPLSPLDDSELQIEFVRALAAPAVLVASSAVGAIGRSLTTLRVLRAEQIDVRAVVLRRFLGLPAGPVWDVGAGLGGVSVELALADRGREVVAAERSSEQLGFLRENRERFGAHNLRIVAGEAPDCLRDEEDAPVGFFIGGTGGWPTHCCQCSAIGHDRCDRPDFLLPCLRPAKF